MVRIDPNRYARRASFRIFFVRMLETEDYWPTFVVPIRQRAGEQLLDDLEQRYVSYECLKGHYDTRLSAVVDERTMK